MCERVWNLFATGVRAITFFLQRRERWLGKKKKKIIICYPSLLFCVIHIYQHNFRQAERPYLICMMLRHIDLSLHHACVFLGLDSAFGEFMVHLLMEQVWIPRRYLWGLCTGAVHTHTNLHCRCLFALGEGQLCSYANMCVRYLVINDAPVSIGTRQMSIYAHRWICKQTKTKKSFDLPHLGVSELHLTARAC